MNKRTLFEQNKRFSKCYLWQLQRDYFEQEGINAWVSQVPFFVTSNPVIAKDYALLVIAFIQDWIAKHPEAIEHPFYILELGTGSGQFSFYVQKHLREMRRILPKDVKIRYIMSDFTESNLVYWEKHPPLQQFLQEGTLDFAIYNMENDEPITLHRSKEVLTPDHFVNPLTVFGNYIFDTVSHDIFSVTNGRLHEVLVSLTTDQDNLRDNKPIDGEKISIDYSPQVIRGPYYYDSHLDSVLANYPHLLKDSSFLFPIGGLRAIKKLQKLTNDKVFLISSDKGYSSIHTMENLGYPSLAFHGSFSMMVNFHAIGEYFKHCGGDAFLQSERKGIKTVVCSSGFKFTDMPYTSQAIEEVIEKFSPADYFLLHRRMREAYQECNLDTLTSHFAFSGWDPYILDKLNSRIAPTMEDADSSTTEYLVNNLPKFIENFYQLPKAENSYFQVAVIYHMTKHYAEALENYQKSEPFCTDNKFGLYYNIALCQNHLGKTDEALENFKKACAIDPDSKETNEWITYLQSVISGDKSLPPPSS